MHGRFERAGLPLPGVQVYGEDVRNAKPHPDAYQLAATRLGISTHCCVVIEDAPAGVTAGKAAGCTVIAITSTHTAEQLPGADAYVSTLAELRDHLAPLASGSTPAGDTPAPAA